MWNLAQYQNHMCLIEERGECLTYEQVAAFGERIADVIKDRCLVFVLCSNTIGSAAGYVAFIDHSIVPVMLGAGMDADLLDKLLKLYQPRYLWIPERKADRFPGQIVFEEYGYQLVRTDYGMNHLLHDDLALLLTTSGSTGSPKFVRQSYRNIRVNAEQIAEYLELDASERPITTLPMHYTYGLSIINSHLLAGAAILLTEKGLMQREFWDFFKQAEATSFGGVPYTYEMLDKLRFMRMDLPSLRCMTQAGGKLSMELHRKFAEYAAEKGKKFIIMYGQCEATARMAYLPAEDSLRKCGSMGIPIPGGKFTLVNADDEEIADADVTGELIYEGSNVAMGYAEKPEDLAAPDEWQGRLETGDMARKDEEGYYYIVGRKKRFLKVYGNRLNLDELERLVKSRYENADCICAGTDDHVCLFVTDKAKAYLQKQYDKENIEDMLRKCAAEMTGLNVTAFRVTVIPEIPQNDAGKIQYKELEKYYEF